MIQWVSQLGGGGGVGSGGGGLGVGGRRVEDGTGVGLRGGLVQVTGGWQVGGVQETELLVRSARVRGSHCHSISDHGRFGLCRAMIWAATGGQIPRVAVVMCLKVMRQ